ncbi:unnamed protein product [Didymodactylos carnosus]|uniref:RING-type domain-containing protein n=1 Tax=Didymodactylos carnosus TaxID=1234261 RepID=A0A8S2F251_9BILA|nr:unnamed protein product [Didymodactylos carnosus]CAF4131655.1 unnamed protein product [Didymodactylos carnosus]
MASVEILHPLKYPQLNHVKDFKQTSNAYYKLFEKLLESIKQDQIKIAKVSIDGNEIKQKKITKQKRQYKEDKVQNSQKSPAARVLASREFHELLTVSEIRKRTYSHWQLKSPSQPQMVNSGFFNCNVGDRVICIYCNIICQQWLIADDPVEIHRILSPNCCFVKSNIVATTTTTRAILNETSYVPANMEIVLAQACNPQFVEIPKRHASYASWPHHLPLPLVDDLIRAGFFYSGLKTIVTCFYCNGSLQNWGEKDNPMIEHARWFPHCSYVKQLCGDDLYKKIQQSKRAAKQTCSNITQEQTQTKSSVSSTTSNSVVCTNAPANQLQIPDESTLSRLVAARLDSPVSQRLLTKFKLSIIKRCYEDQLRLKQDDFLSDSDLYMACLILQKQIEIIDGRKDNIIIPSKRLLELTEKNKRETIMAQLNATVNVNGSDTEEEEEVSEMVTSTPSIEPIDIKKEEKPRQKQTETINVCVLCLTDEKCLACMPCGHLATCVPCGHSLHNCPLCRREIKAFIRVYI